MGKVVVDTGVVLALLDRADAHHESAREAVAALASTDIDYRQPAVVFAEALVAAAKISPEELQHAKRLLVKTFGPVYEVDAPVAEAAAVLRARYPWLRLPDALILATAQIERADVVLTADKRWAKVSDKVQVIGRDGRRPGRAG